MVTAELLRRDVLRSLRQALLKKIKKQKGGGGGGLLSALDKWHFAVIRRAQASDDPLLPAELGISDLVDVENLLADELVGEGLSRASAESVSAWHRKQYVKASKTLAKKLKRRGLAGDSDAGGPVSCTSPSQDGSDGLLTLSQGEELRVQIHLAQLAKLRALSMGAGGGGSADETQFLLATLCLLVRYQALGGGGFQCAIPPPVFTCLEELWGIKCEGFASPLNCRLSAGQYCSAFPDTDTPFGAHTQVHTRTLSLSLTHTHAHTRTHTHTHTLSLTYTRSPSFTYTHTLCLSLSHSLLFSLSHTQPVGLECFPAGRNIL